MQSMPKYFSDLDNGTTKYVDEVGTELADPTMIRREAIGFLAQVFSDSAGDDHDQVFVVTVRNEALVVVLTTTLTLRSNSVVASSIAEKDMMVVLIVEDDPFARMRAVDLVRDAGYAIVEAKDADEALAILHARSDIRVVFTDIRMPGSMDGLKLASFVRNKWPLIKIITTSAHFSGAGSEAPDGIFLSKPYTPASIAGALRIL